MSVEIIQERLLSYHCQTVLDQENALKEIAQENAMRYYADRIPREETGMILYGMSHEIRRLTFHCSTTR